MGFKLLERLTGKRTVEKGRVLFFDALEAIGQIPRNVEIITSGFGRVPFCRRIKSGRYVCGMLDDDKSVPEGVDMTRIDCLHSVRLNVKKSQEEHRYKIYVHNPPENGGAIGGIAMVNYSIPRSRFQPSRFGERVK